MTRKALRLYEAKGQLPAVGRAPNGYRRYRAEDIEALVFIRRARTLGLHLDDIADILAVRDIGTAPCTRVRGLLEDRIAEIDAAVAGLLALRDTGG